MTILKCKMCGDNIEVSQDKTYGTCDSCGSTMTLPKIDDDQKANLYNRANHFRRQNEFDKALKIYERIISEDDTQAEAHWGAVLCRFGIEYVEESGKRVPTCHRASYDSILQDVDYLAAVNHSQDVIARKLYEDEADYIANVQKEILSISNKEKPYDVFICYKETDASGSRTKDSTLAQDVYYQLTQEGFKVFFSRITLEDKLGTAYEPYIFSALNTAKVMVAIGTQPEYFNAVWVKNEWSRYLNLLKTDKSRLLIPCYRDMDAYDIPEELSMLQSQDMSKIGFAQDLIRGIKKVLTTEETPTIKTVESVKVASDTAVNIDSLLKRVSLFLEDSEWDTALSYCDKVLDLDAECAMAYLYRVCAELQCKTIDALASQNEQFLDYKDCIKAIRFADETLKKQIDGYDKIIVQRLEKKQKADALKKIKQKKIAKEMYEKFKIEVDHAIPVLRAGKNPPGAQELNEEYTKLTSELSNLGLALFSKKRQEKERLKELMQKNRSDLRTLRAQYIVSNYREIIRATAILGQKISANGELTALCNASGSVQIAGTNIEARLECLNPNNWTNTIAISAGLYHLVGLLSNGRVLAIGNNTSQQCALADKWKNIVAISAGDFFTAGLKSNGTVITQSSTEYLSTSGWKNIISISAGSEHVVGLDCNGRVAASGNSAWGQCAVYGWRDIAAISAGKYFTVGLKSDGTVVATGDNLQGQCNVGSWQNMIAITAGAHHTVGLKSDGTVIATGHNGFGQCNVVSWRNIIAISAGEFHTIGLKSDGTVVAVGNNKSGQCNVANWCGITI